MPGLGRLSCKQQSVSTKKCGLIEHMCKLRCLWGQKERQAQPPERNSFWTPSLSRPGQELPQKVLSYRPLALSTALQDSSCSLALSVSLAKSFSHFCTSFFSMFVPGMSWKNVLACLGSKPKSSLQSKRATKKPKASMQQRKEK